MNRFAVDPGWKVLLADIGLPVEELLALAELPKDLFQRQQSRLTPAEYYRLWISMERMTGEPRLPILLLKALSSEVFDPASFAALCSPNLSVAVRRIRQFKPLIGPMSLMLEESGQGLQLTIGFGSCPWPAPSSLVAVELGYFVQLARMGTRHGIVPEQVVSPLRLEPATDFSAFFGCEVTPGDRLQLCFSAADAQRPFITENASMWSFFEPELRQRLSRLRVDASTTERVRSALLELIPSGRTSAVQVARHLAVSTRTLQRRLNDENASFSAILNSVREELARHYLRHSQLPYAQISFLLGYGDPNSFYRAFNGWTGTTPDRVRSQLIQ